MVRDGGSRKGALLEVLGCRPSWEGYNETESRAGDGESGEG